MIDLGALRARIIVDNKEANRNLDDTSGKIKEAGSITQVALKGVGKVAAGIAKSVAVVAGATATAIVAMSKQAIEAYAEYEQLVGGVDTLFKDASKQVQEYAANAFKTAGMSANEYMDLATSFSASLLQSLGGDTKAAAEYADRAISDMSDNANKMGSDIKSVENAYRGFAKGNFTMLDNLKLGYGGTKEEMERLLKEANRLNRQQGIYTNYQIDSYADIVDAIHVVQDEMEITGTTMDEAEKTIEGSLNMVKASWKNLMVAMADGENFDVVMEQFVYSIKTFASNVFPVVQQTLNGVVMLIEQLAPQIIAVLPVLVAELLPGLIDSVSAIITALLTALPELIQVLVDAMPGILAMLGTALVEAIPLLIESAQTILDGLAAMLSNPEFLYSFLDTAITIISQLGMFIVQNLPLLVGTAIDLITNFCIYILSPENLATILTTAIDLVLALVDAIIQNVFHMYDAAFELCSELWDSIMDTDWWGLAGEIIDAILEGLKNAWHRIKDWFSNAWDNLFGGKSVDINANVNGSHRTGIRAVPYDGYLAELHRGEMILTNAEAREYKKETSRKTNSENTNIVVNNYSPKALDEVESARQFKRVQRELALGVV